MTTPASDSSKDTDKKIGIVEFCTGKNEAGRPVYCYVSIRPSQYDDYLEKVAAGEIFDPADYGDIIKEGEGRAPSKEIMQEMERVYNVRHNFENMLEDELHAFTEALHKKKQKKTE